MSPIVRSTASEAIGMISGGRPSTAASEAIGMISGGRPSVAHREEYRQ